MKTKLKLILFLVLLFGSFGLAKSSEAANWYVRPSGGSGSGTSWTAAWNGFNGINWNSVACGDTIWVAGGTYTQDLILQKNCTSGSQLFIRKARVDASGCVSAAGWSSDFNATVRQVNAGISILTSVDYNTVSGRTTASGGSHGWFIDFTASTSGTGIYIEGTSTDADYNTFEYFDIQGPGDIIYDADGRGVDWTPFSSADHNTVSHAKIWDWESAIYNVGINYSTFEYIEMYNLHAVNWNCGVYNPCFHPNGIFIHSATGGTIRYCLLREETNGVGEGIFFEQSGGASAWKIYGNRFVALANSKGVQLTSAVDGLLLYNNSFTESWVTFSSSGYCGAGSESKNNIIVDSDGDSANCGTSSNNISITTTPNPFSDSDLHIVSDIGVSYPRNAGCALGAPFNLDPDGSTRGADGVWDIGAYEYVSGSTGDTTAPASPGGLTVR